jgi:putative flippase GtrA
MLAALPRPSTRVRTLLSHELVTFLVVGGTGYVIDVVAFNLLLSSHTLAGRDPSLARVIAMCVAMVVTYAGNRFWTWRDASRHNRRREVALFVLFNLVGLGISVLTLVISHDLLGLTSRLADNISANGVGLVLGTAFRFWSYRRFVFAREELRLPDEWDVEHDLDPAA